MALAHCCCLRTTPRGSGSRRSSRCRSREVLARIRCHQRSSKLTHSLAAPASPYFLRRNCFPLGGSTPDLTSQKRSMPPSWCSQTKKQRPQQKHCDWSCRTRHAQAPKKSVAEMGRAPPGHIEIRAHSRRSRSRFHTPDLMAQIAPDQTDHTIAVRRSAADLARAGTSNQQKMGSIHTATRNQM